MLTFTPSRETVAPRGAAFPLVAAIKGNRKSFDDFGVVTPLIVLVEMQTPRS
jgi:hypothetical protein